MNKIYINIFCFLLEAMKEDGYFNSSDILHCHSDSLESLSVEDWKSIYQECKFHGILSQSYEWIEKYCASRKIVDQWQLDAMKQIARNLKILEEQNELLTLLRNQCPVIIKGAAAAYCYPNPEYRQMGDIDLLVLNSNIESMKNELIEAGYVLGEEDRRHISFFRNTIKVELHRRNTYNVKQTEWFDRMDYVITKAEQTQEVIISGYKIPIFDNTYNGLIILTHLLHHMAGGIGLRQLIDWRMYAERFLSDEEWNKAFRNHVEELDIVDYTKIVTRTCQIYLGLRDDITWCRDVDEEVCMRFIEYVLAQGNFGSKVDYNNHSMDVLIRSSGIKKFFVNLQKQGTYNWKILKKYPFLLPFAWIYQGIRYVKRGFENNVTLKDLRKEKIAKEEMLNLFRNMGLK